ncbi:YgaP family membrane protein [Gynuella sp.]|uniref:YgaP family membrane protein n=1 Tax=Gynuella sp. TaxID=2969146 RepID=UPI003D0F362D
MNIDRIVMAFAGFVIMLSLLLSQIHHPYWLFLTTFVGLNLFQAAFTGFCPLALILKKVGGKSGAAFS